MTGIRNNDSTSVNPVMCFLLTELTRPRHHNNGWRHCSRGYRSAVDKTVVIYTTISSKLAELPTIQCSANSSTRFASYFIDNYCYFANVYLVFKAVNVIFSKNRTRVYVKHKWQLAGMLWLYNKRDHSILVCTVYARAIKNIIEIPHITLT